MPAPKNRDRRASRAPFWPPRPRDRRPVRPSQAKRSSCANPPIVELGGQKSSLRQVTFQPLLFALCDPVADAGGEVGSEVLVGRRGPAPTRLLDNRFEVPFRPSYGSRHPVRPEPVSCGISSRGPHRVDDRQPCKALPRLPKVVNLHALQAPDLERLIPDEQRRVVLGERPLGVRRNYLITRRSVVHALQQDLGEHLARRRLARKRHPSGLSKRLAVTRGQQHAHNQAVRGYAVALQTLEAVAVARPACRGDEAELDLAREERRVGIRGRTADQLYPFEAAGSLEAEPQGQAVQVVYEADADHLIGTHHVEVRITLERYPTGLPDHLRKLTLGQRTF